MHVIRARTLGGTLDPFFPLPVEFDLEFSRDVDNPIAVRLPPWVLQGVHPHRLPSRTIELLGTAVIPITKLVQDAAKHPTGLAIAATRQVYHHKII